MQTLWMFVVAALVRYVEPCNVHQTVLIMVYSPLNVMDHEKLGISIPTPI